MVENKLKMKAVVFEAMGDFPVEEKVRVVDVATPVFGAKEVVVKVHAASLNPVDWKILKGYLALIKSLQPVPFVAGFDLAGEVVEVGKDCTRLKRGDLVYAMAHFTRCGAFAEFVSISEDLVALKPRTMSFEEAASIPLVGLTTWQSIVDFGRLEPGQKVFINGGSGGTGTFAIQLAKQRGAYVATTCSDRNIDLMKRLGADEVINYKQQDYGEVLKGQNYDVVYDTVGGYEVWTKSQAILKPRGAFATIAGDRQAPMSISSLLCLGSGVANRKFWSLLGSPYYAWISCRPNHQQLDTLRDLIDDGKIKAVIDRTYSLNDAVEAFKYLMSGRATGKVIIKVL